MLNVPATVRFKVQRQTLGRRVGTTCVKRSAANRKRPHCTRFVNVSGSISRTRPAGADTFAFTGRLAGRTLARARYRLLATPTADARTGTTRHTSFRIVT